MTIGIVINTFVKDDMIFKQIDNLSKVVDGKDVKILFFQDNTRGNEKYSDPKYLKKHNHISKIINNNINLFQDAQYVLAGENRGCYKACKEAIDLMFRQVDYVIAMEDDVFLSQDSIDWFIFFYKTHLVSQKTNKLFVAAESIYFDGRELPINRQQIETHILKYSALNYQNFYTTFNFVPSSIFATTKEIWNTTGHIRGDLNGDNKLCKYMKDHEYECIFPIVHRAVDIGMMHEDGYSIKMRGNKTVKQDAQKNQYLTTDAFPNVTYPLEHFDTYIIRSVKDELFRDTVLLKN